MTPRQPRATVVAVAFCASLLERWVVRRRPHELAWAVALGLFACGSLSLWAGAALGWSGWTFRLFYAYNPLRLYERPYCNDVLTGAKVQSCSAELITRDMFPQGGAGDYTYQEAIQAFGAQNLFREPRKTFRLTVSTTF